MTDRRIRAFCREHGFVPLKVSVENWVPSYLKNGKPVRSERSSTTRRECWERCEELAQAWAEHCSSRLDTPSLGPAPWQVER